MTNREFRTGALSLPVFLLESYPVFFFESYIAGGVIENSLPLLVPQRTGDPRRHAEGEMSSGNDLPRGEHRPGSELGAALHHRTVKDPRSDADEATIFQSAAVDHRGMADHHVLADVQGEVSGGMEDRSVLNIAAGADPNFLDVPAGDDAEPQGNVIPQVNVSGHHRIGGEKDAFTALRPSLTMRVDGHEDRASRKKSESPRGP